MAPLFLVFLGSLLSFLYILRATLSRRNPKKSGKQLPPGPPTLPIIGNLHMLGGMPHRTLHRLAQKYGPIMSLKLGSVTTIVVSSPQAAEQFLKTHDLIFASRPFGQAAEYLSYGTKALAFSPYGSYWRSLRKLCTTQLLSNSRIKYFTASRKEEMNSLVAALKEAAAAGEVVDMSDRAAGVIENMMYRMIVGYGKSDEFDLMSLAHEGMRLAGAFNLSDFIPSLAPFDIQGLRRSFKKLSGELDKVLEGIIREHEKDGSSRQQGQHKDFVDLLLSMLDEPLNPGDDNAHIIDRTTIKSVIQDMIVGSFDTSSTAIEWGLSELLKHPNVMRKLQEEIRSTVGMNRMVEESDLGKLSYLDKVVKETLRLHTVAPFVVPHEAMEDVTIDGYYIPKKARIVVSIWSIGRDPEAWPNNVEEFLPERYDGSNNVDIGGQDFRLIPFGSGRRGCPGMNLGLTATRIVLAQLVHCFDWELPDGMKPEELDMTEKYGLSMPRANHLLAKPTYRLHI